MRPLSDKQWAILDFIHESFSAGDGPLSVAELADAVGYSGSNMSLTMFSLQRFGFVEMVKSHGRDGNGSANVIVAVDHPERGHLSPEAVAFDDVAKCWRFEADMPQIILRACLCCGQSFRVSSRFLRFCDNCKSTDEWRSGSDAGDYLSNGHAILSNRVGGFRKVG